MKRPILLTLLFGVMLLCGACSDSETNNDTPPTPPPPTPEEEFEVLSQGPFEITLLELYASSLKLFIAPEQTEEYYWHGVITRDYLATFGDLSDIPSAVAAYTASRLAEYPDTPPTELLTCGDLVRDIIGLQPRMEIILFACHADEQGRITSPVQAIGLTMPELSPSENILKVEVQGVTATNAELTITPSNNDPYVWMELPEELYAGKSDEELKAFLEQYYTPFFALHTSKGPLYHSFLNKLEPDTGYMILAFGYDGGFTTALFTTTFRTKSPGDPSLTTFDFSIARLSSRSVDVTVIPSDPSVNYLAILAEESLLSEYGEVGSEAALSLIDEAIEMAIRWGECEDRAEFAESYAHRGNADINWNLTPGKRHYICAVALDSEGEFATEATLREVIAPEVELSEALVEATYGPYFDGDQLYALDAELYADYAGCAVLPIRFTLNDQAAYAIYTLLEPASLEGISDDQLTSLLLNGEYLDDLTFFTEEHVDLLLDWEKEYILCMIAMDQNDYAGALIKERVAPLERGGISPVEEYTPYEGVLSTPRTLTHRTELFGRR